jgi:hypothetical protein
MPNLKVRDCIDSSVCQVVDNVNVHSRVGRQRSAAQRSPISTLPHSGLTRLIQYVGVIIRFLLLFK